MNNSINTRDLPLPIDKLRFWAEHCGDREVLFQPIAGQLKTFTWQEIYQQAKHLASALVAMEIVIGDKVAILSKNCAEWFITDFALMLAGYISVPIYPTANAGTIRYILENAECRAIFVGKLDNSPEQESGIDSAITRLAFPYPTMHAQHQWSDLLKQPVNSLDFTPDPEAVMTILYTSGSTGEPKGALHSFANYVNAGKHTGQRMQLTSEDRCLSYLPLAHCTERAYIESSFLTYGFQCYFVESLESFSRDLQRASPTMFGSVPRLWTLFQKSVLEKVPQKKLSRLLKIPVISSLTKKSIKKGLGLQDARLFLSGSAPLSEKILEWYQKIDITISEGWGMTETLAVGCLNKPGMPVKLGTICHPGENCKIKIADDGEILIRSDSTMLGYYKDPEKTAETIQNGYVHTGDLGAVDEQGYVSITGRKKDIFKTEKGKYVAPIPIEKQFAENEYIELMCLMGSMLKQPVLVINLSEHAKALNRDQITQSLQVTLSQVNQTLEKHARVGRILISNSAWTTESGELTPTLKVKRHVIEKNFLAHALESYNDSIEWLSNN